MNTFTLFRIFFILKSSHDFSVKRQPKQSAPPKACGEASCAFWDQQSSTVPGPQARFGLLSFTLTGKERNGSVKNLWEQC